MAAHDNLGLQFEHNTLDLGERKPVHQVRALAGPTGTEVGQLLWNSKQIRNVIVSPDQQRRGIATRMLEHATMLSDATPSIPKPKHSSERTVAGDAWARSVGGRLPRRKG